MDGSSIRGVATYALAGLVLSAPALAAKEPLASAFREPMRRARRAAPELGVHIVDLQTGEEVLAHQPDQRLTIASNTKLFTSAAALETLGPDYFFETPLLLRGSRRDDTLVGDLAIVGSGDPNISGRHHFGDPLAVFRGWAAKLRAAGIRRIDGDLLLYHGAFEDRRIHPDWPVDQLSKCYEAPIAALSFNDNCVAVTVRPGASSGLPARVELRPSLGLFTLRNEAVTTSSVSRHRVAIDRVPGTNELVVSGRVYRRARPLEAWVTVKDPVEYFGIALVEGLKQGGVSISGRIEQTRELPYGPWWRFSIHRSDLLTTIGVINTVSQNFYAESLLKALGARVCADGSWEAGRSAIQEFLAQIGIPPGDYDLADGSGLSRNNRFSARHLTHLLEYMVSHPRSMEFWASLPVSGQKDHRRWRSRLAREPYRRRVFAKTGSLSGVSALSGYARAASGKLYAFSILGNKVRSVFDARRAQDRILMTLIDNG